MLSQCFNIELAAANFSSSSGVVVDSIVSTI